MTFFDRFRWDRRRVVILRPLPPLGVTPQTLRSGVFDERRMRR